MQLRNQQIYDAAIKLASFEIEGKIPVKINFFLQKNIQTLAAAGEEIEKARQKVISEFGQINEEGTHFIVPPEKLNEAQQELNDLFGLEQELNIHTFKLDDFEGINLTYQQLSAIMFMIEE